MVTRLQEGEREAKKEKEEKKRIGALNWVYCRSSLVRNKGEWMLGRHLQCQPSQPCVFWNTLHWTCKEPIKCC